MAGDKSKKKPGTTPVKKKRPLSLLDPATGKVKPKKSTAKKKKAKTPKPKPITPEQQIEQKLDALLDEDFEFGLLESSDLAFPITDPSIKLTKFQQKLQRIARNKKIHELAIVGAVVRQISTQLTKSGWTGAGKSNVAKVLKKALDVAAMDADLTAEQRKRLELDKIDQAELMHFGPFLKSSGADEAEKRSRIMERIWRRRDALLGLQKPLKTEISGPEGGPIHAEITTDLSKLSDAELLLLKNIQSKLDQEK